MAEENHHHHHYLFHHNKDEDKPVETVYSETSTGYATTDGGYSESTTEGYGATTISTDDYRKEEKHHKHLEHLGELDVAAAGAYALIMIHVSARSMRQRKIRACPQAQDRRGGCSSGCSWIWWICLHEHHEKKEAKNEDEEAHGKKHHHLFG